MAKHAILKVLADGRSYNFRNDLGGLSISVLKERRKKKKHLHQINPVATTSYEMDIESRTSISFLANSTNYRLPNSISDSNFFMFRLTKFAMMNYFGQQNQFGNT